MEQMVQNAVADPLSFELQRNSAKLRTSSGKSQLSCCHQWEGCWKLNGLGKLDGLHQWGM